MSKGTGKLKNIILLALCTILAAFVLIYNIIGGAGKINPDKDKENVENLEEDKDKDFAVHIRKEGIAQEEVCRLLSYLHYSKDEQNKLEIPEELTELLDGVDGAKHIAAAVAAGYFSADLIDPDQELTCGGLRDLLIAVCREEEIDYYTILPALPERMTTVSESDPLYLEEFLSVYEVLCDEVLKKSEGKTPSIKSLYILSFGSGTTLYNEYGEKFSYDGCEDYSQVLAGLVWQNPKPNELLSRKPVSRKDAEKSMAGYENSSIKVMCAGNQVLYIRGEVWETVTVPNVWVIEAAGTKISAFVNGENKEFRTGLPLMGNIDKVVCDIDIYAGKVCGLTVKSDVIQGKVLLTTENVIEVEGYGQLELEEHFRIYKIYGDLAMEKTNRILVGYTITDFVVSDGKICAALIKEKLKADNIRVLINTTSYKSYYHDTVELTADREFTVTKGEEITKYRAGETVSFSAEKQGKEERAVVETVGGEGKITLLSVSRSCGNPAYRGTIEVASGTDGLLVVNELSMEEYLYAVIPSEMPTSYGQEALKVQAVCARSYAFNQLVASRYRTYGAHVDDSVNSQVYNNVAENEASILAVKDTYGFVAAFEGNVITAYYFSTSCGHTASYEEVWESASPIAYLTGCLQNPEKEEVDFSVEKEFRKFILDAKADTFEKSFQWYRWEVLMPAEQFSAQLCAATGLDTVTGAKVTKRGKSGIALELTVEGTKESEGKSVPAVGTVSYQTAIRAALAPKKTAVVRRDGSETANMSLLPSAFFVLDEVKEDGKTTAWKLRGGGYGHGTGMSQNGVKAMVEAGYQYEDIIGHYYTGSELIFLY